MVQDPSFFCFYTIYQMVSLDWKTNELKVDVFLLTLSLFQALCQWRIERTGGRRVGSGKEKGEVSLFLSRIPLAADPACRPLAFSIILTDREPGTG